MSSTPIILFWERLIAADPGLSRLLLATRVTLAVAFAVVASAIGAAEFGQPVSVAVLGAMVAMQASLQINDPEPRTTMLLAMLPAILGIVLGAVFASRGLLADVMFLAVLFVAVAVRKFGPRWTAFGTLAMMTYFFALFLGATVTALPSLIAIIVGAMCITYAVHFILLPDRPGWIARRTIAAFEARIRFVAGVAQEVLETRDPPGARRRLRAATFRLNETAASIEARLGHDATDEVRIIFDAELAAEDLAVSANALRDAAAPVPPALSFALTALVRGRTAEAAQRAAELSNDAVPAHAAARAVAAAIVDLGETIVRVDSATETLALSTAAWSGGAGIQQPALRQAIQVTIASALAIAIGEVLSPQRWSWAVLATYFVFVGTASAGETLARAWSRIGGTALGVVAGVIVGNLAGGHPWLDIAAIFGCLFVAVYLLRISQTAMMFFITALLALLFIVLGRFSDGILEVRLEETAVGAICGGFAATFILPTRTYDVVRSSARDALEATQAVIAVCIAHLLDVRDAVGPLDAARVVEERVQHFVSRAKPTIAAPTFLGSGHELRRWIVSLSACSYYARMLARAVDRMQHPVPAAVGALLRHIEQTMTANIAAAGERVNGRHDGATTNTLPLFDDLRREAASGTPDGLELLSATHLLERLDRTIARLARDEGTITDVA